MLFLCYLLVLLRKGMHSRTANKKKEVLQVFAFHPKQGALAHAPASSGALVHFRNNNINNNNKE